MEKEEYKIMYDMEDNYWWYVGLRRLVFSSIDMFVHKEEKLSILDAGCGTGKILESCKAYTAHGLDISEEALNFCKARGLSNIIKGSICDIPFEDNSFDVVISMDVLYHMDVADDMAALKEFYRITSKNGILTLNLPAYNFIRSRHDDAVHAKHRYTYKELKKKIEKVGFRIERISYRNSILFPLAVVRRMLEKVFFVKDGKMRSDLKPLPAFLNKFFAIILLLENILILSGIKFPFGLSIYCVARKKEII